MASPTLRRGGQRDNPKATQIHPTVSGYHAVIYGSSTTIYHVLQAGALGSTDMLVILVNATRTTG